jgi:hypothetical protein
MEYLPDEKNTLPYVSLNEKTGEMIIKGRSTSTSAEVLFEEIIENVKKYLETNFKSMEINIDLEFFNTPTSKKLLDLLKSIKRSSNTNGFEILIKWYFEKDDEDMFDSGKDYEYILEVPFEFIEKKNIK